MTNSGTHMTLEKIIPQIIESFNDRHAEYSTFLELSNKIDQLKGMTPINAFTCTAEELNTYVALRHEISSMLMPLIQTICDLKLLIGVKFEPNSATMDDLGEPCLNGGIQLSIQDKVCEECGETYGHWCRNCY